MRKNWMSLAVFGGAIGLVACGATGGENADTELADEVGEASQPLRDGVQGFAWVHGTGPVDPNYAHTTERAGLPTVTHGEDIGEWKVKFPGFGHAATAGNVQVVSYGLTDNNRCKVKSWERIPNTGDMEVRVQCHTALGNKKDSAFVVRFLRASTVLDNGPGAYLRIANPELVGVTVERSFNSTGGPNHVTHFIKGEYDVTLENLALRGGAVQVTAFGSGPEHCKVVEWKPSGNHQFIRVRCFDGFGNLVNAAFSLNYIGSPGSVGIRNHGAFVWADQPGKALYDPAADWSRNTGERTASCSASNKAGRIGDDYFIRHTDMPELQASPHVTGYGLNAHFCKIGFWDRVDGQNFVSVITRCFNGVGAPDNNTQYVETYATVATGFGCL